MRNIKHFLNLSTRKLSEKFVFVYATTGTAKTSLKTT